MVPAFFRLLVRWETQLTNWPWLLAPSAHAPMRSEIVQPLGNKILGTFELQLSMTTVALKSGLVHSSLSTTPVMTNRYPGAGGGDPPLSLHPDDGVKKMNEA